MAMPAEHLYDLVLGQTQAARLQLVECSRAALASHPFLRTMTKEQSDQARREMGPVPVKR